MTIARFPGRDRVGPTRHHAPGDKCKEIGASLMKRFDALSETEVLALAISNEEEDSRIYADFAHSLREEYPSTATMFADMAAEESQHRRRLIDLFTERFGDHIPLIRRQDVRGNLERKPHWQIRAAGVEAVRKHAAQMERDAEQFYRLAAGPPTRMFVSCLAIR